MAIKWVVVFVLLAISLQRADAVLNAKVFFTSSNSIILQWNKEPTAASYEISLTGIANPSAPTGFVTYGPNTVIGSVTGLAPDTEYGYTLTAKDAGGSPVATESATHYTAPEVLDDIVSVTPIDSTTVSMVFVPKAGVMNYVIRAQHPTDYSIYSMTDVTSSPAQVSGLQPYTQYKFSIMSSNAGGNSQPTHPVTATTLLPPLQIQSSSSSDSTIELTWTTVPNAVLYTVSLLKLNASPSDKISHNTTDPTFTFTGLDPGSLYHIESHAWDSLGRQGEESAPANQTTRPPAPVSVSVTIATVNDLLHLNVSWSIDPAVTGDVWFNASSDLGQSCGDSSLGCQLGPVSCGEVHSVSVIALNVAGASAPSPTVTFITVPCPPQNLAVVETSPGSCNFTWDTVALADGYQAYVKNADGVEKTCNTTTGTSCDFTCECGYTYLMNVFAHNSAGLSQVGPTVNYTTIPCCPTMMNVSLVSTDTLEIEWVAGRGAELYETRANDSSGVILCNDTAPVCVLSYLSCDSTYSVTVIPCNDLSGCNLHCPALTKDTAACMPTGVSLTRVDSSSVTVSWSSTNRAATFLVTAKGDHGQHNCSSGVTSCDLRDLDCGCEYEVSVTATSAAGNSLPSYTHTYETEPCCPSSLSVTQVTQAMTNVSWAAARGASIFLTSLTSSKGHARCHTQDTHCLMGCITCGTNYTVTMEAHSLSGKMSNCSYQGFSSSLCCPFGVRVTRLSSLSVRVSWRSTSGTPHVTEVGMSAVSGNYSCRANPGDSYCDLSGLLCGDEYSLEVAPVRADGSTETFCPHRKYGVGCAGSGVGPIFFRGKRSLD